MDHRRPQPRPLQADDFAPAHAGPAFGDDEDEVVVVSGQDRRPLGDQEDLQRGGPLPLRVLRRWAARRAGHGVLVVAGLVHTACRALAAGDCDVAVADGST
jgi:hypothetical protein